CCTAEHVFPKILPVVPAVPLKSCASKDSLDETGGDSARGGAVVAGAPQGTDRRWEIFPASGRNGGRRSRTPDDLPPGCNPAVATRTWKAFIILRYTSTKNQAGVSQV
ncbi:MAG: hypothetical protein M3O09_10000, partial [Acidobacteriota bacterium]|nr:hypothetical protein [Acidobacteriota bacterium]